MGSISGVDDSESHDGDQEEAEMPCESSKPPKWRTAIKSLANPF